MAAPALSPSDLSLGEFRRDCQAARDIFANDLGSIKIDSQSC
jgi:hypothetical protein